MADESTTVTDETEPKEVLKIDGVECRTFKEMILYKMDRTIAIVGIILLGALALSFKTVNTTASQIVMVAIGGLVTYVGGRTGTK